MNFFKIKNMKGYYWQRLILTKQDKSQKLNVYINNFPWIFYSGFWIVSSLSVSRSVQIYIIPYHHQSSPKGSPPVTTIKVRGRIRVRVRMTLSVRLRMRVGVGMRIGRRLAAHSLTLAGEGQDNSLPHDSGPCGQGWAVGPQGRRPVVREAQLLVEVAGLLCRVADDEAVAVAVVAIFGHGASLGGTVATEALPTEEHVGSCQRLSKQ